MNKALMFLGLLGHLLCWYCDLLLTKTPSGHFRGEDLKDSAKMAAIFAGMPPEFPLRSALLGVAAMTAELFAYLGLARWMRTFSAPAAAVMYVSTILFFMPGVAHHVICGVVEWLYLRLDRTEEGQALVLELFKKTSVTMIVCYLGMFAVCLALFFAVVTGRTDLPRWAAAFTELPIFLALTPLRPVGQGNLAGAIMFFCLLLLM